MDSTIPLSPDQVELLHSASIASQLPVKFDTGYTFTGMQACCAACNQAIADERLTGKVQRPTVHMAEIFAVGYCTECNLVSIYRYRMYDDHRFTTLRSNGWCEGRLRSAAERKTGLHHKMGRALRWLFTF